MLEVRVCLWLIENEIQPERISLGKKHISKLLRKHQNYILIKKIVYRFFLKMAYDCCFLKI